MPDYIGGMLSGMKAVGDMMSNYESRKVARDEANGLTVSTVYTSDEGYETALLDVDGEVFPVERYPNRESAIEGHAKWLKFAKSNETQITRLDGLRGCVPKKKFTIKREVKPRLDFEYRRPLRFDSTNARMKRVLAAHLDQENAATGLGIAANAIVRTAKAVILRFSLFGLRDLPW